MNRLHRKFARLFRANDVSFFEKIVYIRHKISIKLFRGWWVALFTDSCGGLLMVGKNCRIANASKLSVGKACYIGDFCQFYCLSKNGVNLGDNVTIREFGWLQLTSDLDNLGEGIWIGSGTYIGPRVILGAAAPLTIGEGCQIGADVHFIAEQHVFEKAEHSIAEQGVRRVGIVIGNGCWIGNGVRILDGVQIGDGCVIGAGSVVTKSFIANSVVVGIPARLLRMRAHSVGDI